MKRSLLALAAVVTFASAASATTAGTALKALDCTVMNPFGVATITLDKETQQVKVVTNYVFTSAYELNLVQTALKDDAGANIRLAHPETKRGLNLQFRAALVEGAQTLPVSLVEDKRKGSTLPGLTLAMGHCHVDVSGTAAGR